MVFRVDYQPANYGLRFRTGPLVHFVQQEQRTAEVSKSVEPDPLDQRVEGGIGLKQQSAEVGGRDGVEFLLEQGEEGRVNDGRLVLRQQFLELSFL